MDFEVQSVTRISGDNQLEKSVVMQQIHSSSFSGDFCAASKSLLPFPGIIIRPFGNVPLPLIPVVLSALKQAVDSKTHKVRDYAFEFDPATISFTNPTWDDELDIHLDRMLDALGLKRSDVERRLDRVILDEKGFRRRKQATDSIQVASFEVQFHSNFKGGSHRVCHQGLDSVFRLGADDSSCANNCWLLADTQIASMRSKTSQKGPGLSPRIPYCGREIASRLAHRRWTASWRWSAPCAT